MVRRRPWPDRHGGFSRMLLQRAPPRPWSARTASSGRLTSGGSSGSSRRGISTSALAAGAAGLGKLALQAYGVLLLLIFAVQRKLIFLPSAYVADPRAQGGDPQVIVLPAGASGGDEKLAAVYFPPPTPDAAVFFHGNADQLGYGAAYLGNIFRKQYGLGFFGVEYPGYGLARPGSPSEKSIYAGAEVMVRHLIDELEVPSSRIALFGQSIGCAVAVEMASRGLGSRVVLLSPFTSMAGMASTIYPFLKPALSLFPFVVLDPFDSKAKAPSITCPTLVVHGLEDEIIPHRMGEELAGAFKDSRFVPIRRFGHNDILDCGDVHREIAAFVAQRAP